MYNLDYSKRRSHYLRPRALTRKDMVYYKKDNETGLRYWVGLPGKAKRTYHPALGNGYFLKQAVAVPAEARKVTRVPVYEVQFAFPRRSNPRPKRYIRVARCSDRNLAAVRSRTGHTNFVGIRMGDGIHLVAHRGWVGAKPISLQRDKFNEVPIPPESMHRVRKLVCLPAMRKARAMEASDWEDASVPFQLRVKDLKRMQPGDRLRVVFLDRNWDDITWRPDVNRAGKPTRPERFFRTHWADYTHQHGAQGTVVWSWDPEPQPFEWEVNYAPGRWFPLVQGGYLSAVDDFGEWLLDGKPHWWEDLPDDMPVGFRGPAIRWADLKRMPKLWWEDE